MNTRNNTNKYVVIMANLLYSMEEASSGRLIPAVYNDDDGFKSYLLFTS